MLWILIKRYPGYVNLLIVLTLIFSSIVLVLINCFGSYGAAGYQNPVSPSEIMNISNMNSSELSDILDRLQYQEQTGYFSEYFSNWYSHPNKDYVVNIVKTDPMISDHDVDIIKDAILSNKTQHLDVSSNVIKDTTYTRQNSVYKLYHYGWQSALQEISQNTRIPIPRHFQIVENGMITNEDIRIILTNNSPDDSNGYVGYTVTSIYDHTIYHAVITIYNVNALQDKWLAAIARHEFGHAIGLGHSPDSNDVMHSIIETNYPYISSCDIQAVIKLYNYSGVITNAHQLYDGNCVNQ